MEFPWMKNVFLERDWRDQVGLGMGPMVRKFFSSNKFCQNDNYLVGIKTYYSGIPQITLLVIK